MRSLRAALLLAALLGALPAAAADAAAKKWSDSAEASFVDTNGNSKTQTTAGKESFSYDFDALWRLELGGGGLGSRNQGQVSAEQYYATQKLQRKVDDRDYAFDKYRWDKNRFAGVADRQEVSVGLGRELWKSGKDLLTGELAPGYLYEERIGSRRISAPMGRAFTKYTHDFTSTSKFSQSVEYLQDLDDKRDSRINTETALTTALSAHFSVKTSYIWNRSNLPPAGVHKDDETTAFALIASF